MKLSKIFCAVPVIGFVTMAAFADDATPPPAGGPMSACRQDVQTLCPGVQRGGGRIMECLKSHETDVSAGCKTAMKEAHARRAQPSGSQPPANPPPTN
jgi:hypothetical protein